MVFKVVFVEDQDFMRCAIRNILQADAEFEVLGEAADGRQGLALLKSMQPDVAIVDIGLPNMDGIELVKQFRQYQEVIESKYTRILILTSHDSLEGISAAFMAGVDSYCLKDFDLEEFTRAVKQTAVGKTWIDPAIGRVMTDGFIRSCCLLQSPPPSEQMAESLLLSEGRNEVEASVDCVNLEDVFWSAWYEEFSRREQEVLSILMGSQPAVNQQSDKNESLDQCSGPVQPLSEREMEVLRLIVEGHTNNQIAERLYISYGTVRTHIRNIYSKLAAKNRTEVTVLALQMGLIDAARFNLDM
ncbi:MAG: response regulator transcription factor [Leptolyngbyaceae cyanobacterium MO_188.B28]|nr:response regulator transcription factor [Leptolyngbyaceae cyanobacterium MO_188.B28]